MGYRKHDHHHDHHGCDHRHHELEDVATPGTLRVTNGEVADFAIPCWYAPDNINYHPGPHCRAAHDHEGWPHPGHPDNICQDFEFAVGPYVPKHGPLQLRDVKLVPIHLTEEGYTTVGIAFDDDQPMGLEAEGYIDEMEDHIVRFSLTARCPGAIKEPQRCRMSLAVANSTATKVDIISVFDVLILPAPLFDFD